MSKAKGAGIILYPEDIERVRRCVKPQYQFAVIYALSRFAQTGEMPTEAELGEGGMVAFEFIFEKVAEALETFRANSEKRRAAVNSRWEAARKESVQSDTSEACAVQDDTPAYTRIQTHTNVPKTKTKTETKTETKTKTEAVDESGRVIGIDGSDLTEAIRAQDTADAMILRYNLPHDIPTREKLLEDLLMHGEARMREVLEKACESNTRDRVTSAYWRAILANAGKSKPRAAPAQQGYQTRDYQTPDFRRMEVDVEAEAKELGII